MTRIVVFAMASASGERGGEAKATDLRALGADAGHVWITRAGTAVLGALPR